MSSSESLHELCLKFKLIDTSSFSAKRPTASEVVRLSKLLSEDTEQRDFLEEAVAIFDPQTLERAEIQSQLGMLEVNLGNYAKAKKLLQNAVKVFEAGEGRDELRMAEALTRLGVAFIFLDDDVKSVESLQRAKPILNNLADRHDLQYAETSYSLGLAFGDVGDYERQKEILEATLPLFEKHYGAGTLKYATKVAGLAAAHIFLGDHKTARELLQKVSIVIENNFCQPRPMSLRRYISQDFSQHYHSVRGTSKIQYGTFNKTLTEGETGKQRARRNSGFGSSLSGAVSGRGLAIIEDSDGQTAVQNSKPSIQRHIRRHSDGEFLKMVSDQPKKDRSDTADALANLGVVYGTLGDYDKEIQCLEQSLSYYENRYGESHVKIPITLANLAFSHGARGDHVKEKELLTRVLFLYERIHGKDHMEVGKTLMNLGAVYGVLGDNLKKKDFLERALRILDANLGPGNIDSAETQICLSSSYRELEDHYTEVKLLEKAIGTFESYYGPHNVLTAEAKVTLALAHGSLGEFKKQDTLLKKSRPIIESHYGPKHFLLQVIDEASEKSKLNRKKNRVWCCSIL